MLGGLGEVLSVKCLECGECPVGSAVEVLTDRRHWMPRYSGNGLREDSSKGPGWRIRMDREEVGLRTEPHSVLWQELGKGEVVKMKVEHTVGAKRWVMARHLGFVL